MRGERREMLGWAGQGNKDRDDEVVGEATSRPIYNRFATKRAQDNR